LPASRWWSAPLYTKNPEVFKPDGTVDYGSDDAARPEADRPPNIQKRKSRSNAPAFENQFNAFGRWLA
jgi:hypothetical protein